MTLALKGARPASASSSVMTILQGENSQQVGLMGERGHIYRPSPPPCWLTRMKKVEMATMPFSLSASSFSPASSYQSLGRGKAGQPR